MDNKINVHDAIELRGLAKSYPRFQLGPLDLTVPRGAICGLIGPNGAGKTTALDLIFGLSRADSGQIRVLGLDHRVDEVALKRRAAYVGPDLNFQIWGKVGKAIRFVRGFYPGWDDAYCAMLMRTFHLNATDRIATLSSGSKTKLSLLLALARRPEVLVLDEPASGLDAISKQQLFGELLKIVEDGERTVLISSHSLSDIERFTDQVGLLKDGKLVLQGRTDEVVERYCMAEFFTVNGTPLASPRPEGLLVLKTHDNRWQALLDQQSGAEEWLQRHGAQQITLTRLTLEELFVALFKQQEEVDGK
jgi:ABC-2 type transport system ATP-binding protein